MSLSSLTFAVLPRRKFISTVGVTCVQGCLR